MPAVRDSPSDHPLLLAGAERETGAWAEVPSPYDGSPVGRVALGDAALAAAAIEAAFSEGAFPQHQRAEVLERAAALVAERREELAITIALEAGKPLKTATVEAERCAETRTPATPARGPAHAVLELTEERFVTLQG